MLQVADVDAYLDALEMCLRAIDRTVRDGIASFHRYISQMPDDAIAEVNARLREASIGYEYRAGEILRVDSQVLHAGVVIPALTLTNEPKFTAVNGEYLKAHEAYRHGDYETSLTECAKAFESTFKVIAGERRWPVKPTDTAAKLIEASVQAGFLQSYVAAGFASLRSMLESGIPPIRNQSSAHGAGATPRVVRQELASFQLHQTAAAIVFIIEAHKAQP